MAKLAKLTRIHTTHNGIRNSIVTGTKQNGNSESRHTFDVFQRIGIGIKEPIIDPTENRDCTSPQAQDES